MRSNLLDYRAFLFDFDGVLGQTMEDNCRAWEHVFAEANIPFDHEEYFQGEGLKPVAVVKYFVERAGLPALSDERVTEIAKAKEKHYRENNQFSLYPGAEEIVHKLRGEGKLLAVVTGASRERIQNTPGLTPFIELFHTSVTAEDSVAGKPAPDPYLLALKKLSIGPEEALVFENAPLGIQSAQAAGIDCVAIASTLSREFLASAQLVFDNLQGCLSRRS